MELRCPTCKLAFERQGSSYAPFCSERCKLLDLGQWLDERYRIAGEAAPVPEQNDADAEDDD